MISYRDAGPVDADVLDRIFRTSFCDTFAHLYSQQDLQAFLESFSLADWEAQLSDNDYLFRIAESDGLAVGYVKLGPLKKLDIVPRGPAMILDQLYVLKEQHGSGLASELMRWAMESASERGAVELYLTVYIDNHRARRFYDRYGFEEVGAYQFMVGNHADEDIIMRKTL